jgi:hypothetical protein
MIKRDFHGYKLEDAIDAVHFMISDVRTAGRTESAELVTGHGIIQKELISLFEQYGLTANVSWSNSGAINVVIE